MKEKLVKIQSITALRETVEKLSEKISGVGKRKSAAMQTELSALKEFAEHFPKRYLKRVDAAENSNYLRSLATNAKTIIDVGVNKGTPKLYKAFNDLPFVLIDPAKDAESRLTSQPKEYQFVNKAIGEKPETLKLNWNSGKTSLLEPKGEFKTWKVIETYDVQVDRLDTIIEGLGVKGPFGIKMDIQ